MMAGEAGGLASRSEEAHPCRGPRSDALALVVQ